MGTDRGGEEGGGQEAGEEEGDRGEHRGEEGDPSRSAPARSAAGLHISPPRKKWLSRWRRPTEKTVQWAPQIVRLLRCDIYWARSGESGRFVALHMHMIFIFWQI